MRLETVPPHYHIYLQPRLLDSSSGTCKLPLSAMRSLLRPARRCYCVPLPAHARTVADRTYKGSGQLFDYMMRHGHRILPVQQRLFDRTIAEFPHQSNMMGGQDVAELLANLIRLSGSRVGIEVGVFTGYTTLAMALALPSDGKLHALDCEAGRKYAAIGEEFWREAEVGHKIDLSFEGGEQVLSVLAADTSKQGKFDFAFVDADKAGYPKYLEHLLPLIRPGGWIAFDNVFAGGTISLEPDEVPHRRVNFRKNVQKFNEILHAEPSVDINMLGVGDGVTIAVKKWP
jgi:caffeoyl-CoA O-methyltransferase